ncbi:hypothetical protein ACFL1G_03195 [Planctomycetota bacterium]
MKAKHSIFLLATVVLGGFVVVWLSTSSQAGEEIYEIRPQISVPEYRTDAARAIDAYERLMERFMNITEKKLITVDTNIEDVTKKLDLIDVKLTRIDRRIARIEKTLGIEKALQPKQKAQNKKANQKSIEGNPPEMKVTD